jgi:hypothetical protein
MLHPKRPIPASIAVVAALVVLVILAALGGAALSQRQSHSPTRLAGWTWDDSAAAVD